MQRLHGMSLLEACDIVGLCAEDYQGTEEPLDWLPSPVDIENFVRPLRAEKQRLKLVQREFYTPPILRGDNA